MVKVLQCSVLVAIACLFSGCAVVGRYSRPGENGNHVTIGLFSFDSVSDGYPMIPLYNSFDAGK